MKTKVLTVFGTRPEAIKLAPVIRELERRSEAFESRICVTGQHREMLDQMLALLEIKPDYDLGVMTASQSLTNVTVAVLDRMRNVFETELPDWVLVQGDTTTTMAGSLGAFQHGCRVAHVEAGLRTFDERNPWPEEINRRVASVVADLHFAPTSTSAENLYREGIPNDRVYVTGNTVIDAVKLFSSLPFDPSTTPVAQVPLHGKRVIVATLHRRETPREAIEGVCTALIAISQEHDDVVIVLPVHLNPNVREPINRLLSGQPNIMLLPTLDYQAMLWLLGRCHFVITDSGGLQEEAIALDKPVLVARHTTERPEGVAVGAAHVVGTDPETIEAWARRLLSEQDLYDRMTRPGDPYGSGDAARRIVDILSERSTQTG